MATLPSNGKGWSSGGHECDDLDHVDSMVPWGCLPRAFTSFSVVSEDSILKESYKDLRDARARLSAQGQKAPTKLTTASRG